MTETSIFDRMTPTSRDLLLLAKQEASAAGGGPIGARHILVALSGQLPTRASQVLSAAALTHDRLLQWLSDLGGEPWAEFPFTESAKRVLAAAREEADAASQTQITPEHYLLALVRENDPPIATLLARHGLSPETVRDRLRQD